MGQRIHVSVKWGIILGTSVHKTHKERCYICLVCTCKNVVKLLEVKVNVQKGTNERLEDYNYYRFVSCVALPSMRCLLGSH